MGKINFPLLKIKIYQPQAHYRIPFTYQRRHTYPIPPYSTVLGLIANVLGIKNLPGQEEPCLKENCNCIYHKFKKLKISICGNFKDKSTEYTWLRNLSKEAHEKRFICSKNRYVAGHIEHIGGQAPCLIDILNDVNIIIYLYHEDYNFLETIKESFNNPNNRTSPLHLGRAEDWIIIKEIDILKTFIIEEINGDYKNFFWIPEKTFDLGYNFDFNKINGLVYNLTTFYKIVNGSRNFEYIRVKLNDGNLGDIYSLYDPNEDIPIFLGDLGGK
ncbi:MAG: type I-B CRISPR-associated protein Cas5b [Dictyoglomaceae bacterium]|nr:type I-B CRISPR-associated protein Cas5b [Dictyoglomaceae bacterium]